MKAHNDVLTFIVQKYIKQLKKNRFYGLNG